MTDINDPKAIHAEIYSVTKHITIHSDNPMDDAINAVIDSCFALDANKECSVSYALEVEKATKNLLVLVTLLHGDEHAKDQK